MFWIFVIFYNHLHQDVNFGQFDPLAPTPWGTPLHHPPLHLQTCLSYPTIWKKVLNHEIIKDFKNFEVEGCHIIFSSFWAIFVNFGANGVSLGNADKPKLPIFHLRIGQRVLWLTANDFFAIHLNMGHAKVMCYNSFRHEKTRPDTWQSSRRQWGKSSRAKTARNSKMFRTDGLTDGPTDQPTQQGVESRVHD